MLIDAGAALDQARTDIEYTPLFWAANVGIVNILERLIAEGADVNVVYIYIYIYIYSCAPAVRDS